MNNNLTCFWNVLYCLNSTSLQCFSMHGIKVLCNGHSLSSFVKNVLRCEDCLVFLQNISFTCSFYLFCLYFKEAHGTFN